MKVLLTILLSIQLVNVTAQKATLQVYCEEGINIYINNKYQGKSNKDMSGLLIENLDSGTIDVKAVKSGYQTVEQTLTINLEGINETSIELIKDKFVRKKYVGLDLHFGPFGLFNVNNVFTKAQYSFGGTTYFDVELHENFAIGIEVMNMWGKPQTADEPRMILSPNLRLNLLFQPFDKVHFNVLVAGGFTLWPERTGSPALTPTFNETRMGWDVRAVAGANFVIGEKIDLGMNFGYWASSSTSDDIVWITHDTMILSMGPRFKF
jgi:hypothetical protein